LKLAVSDIINWEIEQGKIMVQAANKPFKKWRGFIKTGKGTIKKDIDAARDAMIEKYR
jgi:hypothetical protein